MERHCTICKNPMPDNRPLRAKVCSFECRQQANRENAKRLIRIKRHTKGVYPACVICGYSKVTDQHHEYGQTYNVCPNCHALITRGICEMVISDDNITLKDIQN